SRRTSRSPVTDRAGLSGVEAYPVACSGSTSRDGPGRLARIWVLRPRIPYHGDVGLRGEKRPSRLSRVRVIFAGSASCASADRPRVMVTSSRSYTHRSEEHTSELQSRENLVCR